MAEAPAGQVSVSGRLRRALEFLLRTPLHPQWLVVRHMRDRIPWVARHARGTVLDVGCAHATIRAHLRCERYYGLDYPATALHLYGTRPDIFGDASRLPVADACVDTVLLIEVVEHLREPGAALAEAARVLKPGGRLLMTVPFAYPLHDQPHDFQRWTAHGVAHQLQRAGLRPVTIEETGSAIAVAAGNLSMALAKGGLDAIAARSWRMAGVVLLPPLILAANLYGVIVAWLFPARGFMPSGYNVEATHR